MLAVWPAIRKPGVRQWLHRTAAVWPVGCRRPAPAPAVAAPLPPPVPLVRPNSANWPAQALLPQFVQDCPVAQKYRHLLADSAWATFPSAPPTGPGPAPSRRPAPLCRRLPGQVGRRSPLHGRPADVSGGASRPGLAPGLSPGPLRHRSLGLRCGRQLAHRQALRPRAARTAQCRRPIPARRHGHRLAAALPPEVNFGDVVAGDTKHIIAWVKENNPKAYIKDRYDKTQQPTGDPDCKLGCKRRHNRGAAGPESTLDWRGAPPRRPAYRRRAATPTTEGTPARQATVGEFYWGYASGVIATKVAGWGEFVLAELTQTFDQPDVIYFFPLMTQVERRLGRKPRYGALDMGFDAHYIYDYFHRPAVLPPCPWPNAATPAASSTPRGCRYVPAGLAMPRKGVFTCHTSRFEHQRGRYACPLRYPQPTGAACPTADPHWAKGGCVVTMPTSIGARIRYQLDRESEAFKTIYKQRTADERVNSQALELGIERPKLRNGAAIANQNTLIYVLINLRALHRCAPTGRPWPVRYRR